MGVGCLTGTTGFFVTTVGFGTIVGFFTVGITGFGSVGPSMGTGASLGLAGATGSPTACTETAAIILKKRLTEKRTHFTRKERASIFYILP
jgi:hypothetical protein